MVVVDRYSQQEEDIMNKHLLPVLSAVLALSSLLLAQEPPIPPDPPVTPAIPTTTRENLQLELQQTTLNLTESRVLRLVNRIGRTYRFMNIATLTTAGPSIEDLTLLGDFSYAAIDDDVLGDDNARELSGSVYVTGRLAEDFMFGLGISESYFHADGDLMKLRQRMYTLDGFMTYAITDEFSVGGFLQYSDIDIENDLVPDASSPTGFTNIADQFNRYAAGLLGSFRKDLDVVTLGVTTSISGFNKKNVDDLLDDEDAAWITIVDVERALTDNLSVDVFASYYTLLDNQPVNGVKSDGSYWSVGFDFAYQMTTSWFVSLGYETQLAYSNYDEHRINAAVAYSW